MISTFPRLLRDLPTCFIVFCSKRRQGKSYNAVLAMILELTHGKRQVVIYMPGLQRTEILAEVHRRGGDTKSAHRRLHCLTRKEALNFWMYRGNWVAPWKVKSVTQGSTEFEEMDFRAHSDCGVMYILDEFGKLFPKSAVNEKWAVVDGYLDLMGKVNDVVIGTTPQFKHIVKAVRDKVDQVWIMKNLNRLQRWGMRAGSGFWTTIKDVEDGEVTEIVVDRAWSPFDIRIGRCYRTEDGDTIKGNQADKGQRAKGLSIPKVVGVCLALAVVAAVLFPRAVTSWARSITDVAFGSKVGKSKAVSTNSPAVAVKPAARTGNPDVEPQPQAHVKEVGVGAPRPGAGGHPRKAAVESFRFTAPRVAGQLIGFTEVRGHKLFYTVDGRSLWNPAGVWDGQRLTTKEGETWELLH